MIYQYTYNDPSRKEEVKPEDLANLDLIHVHAVTEEDRQGESSLFWDEDKQEWIPFIGNDEE